MNKNTAHSDVPRKIQHGTNLIRNLHRIYQMYCSSRITHRKTKRVITRAKAMATIIQECWMNRALKAKIDQSHDQFSIGIECEMMRHTLVNTNIGYRTSVLHIVDAMSNERVASEFDLELLQCAAMDQLLPRNGENYTTRINYQLRSNGRE